MARAALECRLLCLAGYEPLADACAVCGEENPAEPVLDAVQGVLRCRTCGQGDGGLALPLCRESLSALRHILYGDAKRLYSFRVSDGAAARLGAAAEAFTAAQLERSFRTLDFYKSLLPEGNG